jgi:hypothetical protein
MNWKDGKEYCEQRGMQMATLKTANELEQVAEQLKQRRLSKTKRADLHLLSFFYFSLLLQLIGSGCLHLT